MSEDTQARVTALVGQQTGVSAARIGLNTRLSFDLGMEGDDAVEFFEEFQRLFSVDLGELTQNWQSYFAPEGVSLWAGLTVLLPIAAFGILLSYLLPKWPDWIFWLVGTAVTFSSIYLWQRFVRGPSENEITIGQLVEAVETGHLRLTPKSRSVTGEVST